MKLTLLPIALAVPLCALGLRRAEDPKPIALGSGAQSYRWVSNWAKLPDGLQTGNTHGNIVVDAKGLIYANTDTAAAVLVFDAEGRFQRQFGKEWAGGLHGMCLARDGERESIWIAHTARHEVARISLEGELLQSIEWPQASGKYEKQEQYNPTAVALAPDGALFVGDGYGRSWVHKYDAQGHYLASFGGPGSEPGQMNCPHGLGLDLRGAQPLLIVCDRENHRLQRFDLDGKLVDVIDKELRRPCTVQQQGEFLLIADLAGRVTILDGKNQLVCHLGDQPDPAKRANNGVPREQWLDGEFVAPHCARWDAKGDLYVMDWLAQGRLTKLARQR